MVYPVSEIFYSIQGEGYWTGCPAVFVRLFGCNLKCEWCDTQEPARFYFTKEEIANKIAEKFEQFNYTEREDILIVITGGEPTIHPYVELCSYLGKTFQYNPLCIETNGRKCASKAIKRLRMMYGMWVTVSPKLGVEEDSVIENYFKDPNWMADELKLVFDPRINWELVKHYETTLKSRIVNLCIQPLSGNFAPAIKFVKENPAWRLSLQTHKIINVK